MWFQPMANEEHGIMFPTKEQLELLPGLIKGRIENHFPEYFYLTLLASAQG